MAQPWSKAAAGYAAKRGFEYGSETMRKLALLGMELEAMRKLALS